MFRLRVKTGKIIEAYGGEIKFIKLNPGHSTTKIIDKVIKAYGKE